ncbi:hypothetical protein GCM10009837_69320 [Streptomyces durmitorensis]
MYLDGFGDRAAALQLSQPPVCEADAGQGAEDSGEWGDEQSFGGDCAADLPGGGRRWRAAARIRGPAGRLTARRFRLR